MKRDLNHSLITDTRTLRNIYINEIKASILLLLFPSLLLLPPPTSSSLLTNNVHKHQDNTPAIPADHKKSHNHFLQLCKDDPRGRRTKNKEECPINIKVCKKKSCKKWCDVEKWRKKRRKKKRVRKKTYLGTVYYAPIFAIVAGAVSKGNIAVLKTVMGRVREIYPFD